jgi:hypothetical protein
MLPAVTLKLSSVQAVGSITAFGLAEHFFRFNLSQKPCFDVLHKNRISFMVLVIYINKKIVIEHLERTYLPVMR